MKISAKLLIIKIVKYTSCNGENRKGDQKRKTSTIQNAFIKGLAEAVSHAKLGEEEKKYSVVESATEPESDITDDDQVE